MKWIILSGLLVVLAIILSLSCPFSVCAAKEPVNIVLEPLEVVFLLDEVIILDVRTPEEFSQGHINNAKNIDFYAADFKLQLASLDKDESYLVYCRSGKRSASAINILEELEFVDVRDLNGGFIAWEEANLPVSFK